MNDILALSQTSLVSMTSREVAELTGKRHSDVLRDIDNLLGSLNAELRLGFKSSSYVDSTGKENRQFELDRDSSYCLVAGYDPNSRMRIIKRWQELESKPTQQSLLPEQRAESIVGSFLRIATLASVPMSFALQLAGAEATRATGLPIDRLLTNAACMTGVKDPDVMLEPTELGKLFGLSGIMMNKKLVELGLQSKVGGQWTPTEAGSALAVRHAWVSGSKSGYNLKWNAGEIEKLMEADLA